MYAPGKGRCGVCKETDMLGYCCICFEGIKTPARRTAASDQRVKTADTLCSTRAKPYTMTCWIQRCCCRCYKGVLKDIPSCLGSMSKITLSLHGKRSLAALGPTPATGVFPLVQEQQDKGKSSRN